MKKNIVLFVLFILPIGAYLFFATGVNGFTHLPIVTKKVPDFGDWHSLKNEKVSLDDKITILGFGGFDLMKNRGNLFNLNEKIYQQYHTFNDLQFVMICPVGKEQDAQKIVDALGATTDMSQWHFIFAKPEEISNYYSKLKLRENLNKDLGTENVVIIDKERNLRGRNGKEDYKDAYSTFHPADLSNQMLDDFKIVLYEYRAALKKNHNATKQEFKD
ncbi:hypothetical protein FNO01nite_02760 [Flavobacterium noncentrifugens]|uniref:Uncharacterized protein n=1 Tax=Flavobacterium noncentrifugens TaxID=1128970 RepID=A0A1G8RW07_9FLAO|nr:hypothetical protein [Flavobacterium noncentrifugens]GEP49604.1 hypothetical protein FNO01nite_02760 [Flavobacterium noncentrifugens]SDJ21142.1 hypothetical protein SAMN04487935_0307 [Flavobacterium noncentrifugens]